MVCLTENNFHLSKEVERRYYVNVKTNFGSFGIKSANALYSTSKDMHHLLLLAILLTYLTVLYYTQISLKLDQNHKIRHLFSSIVIV